MNKFKKCLSLLLCFALVLSMLTANIITVSANETQTVHLLENGGFEQADEYDFPLNWDSEGKNLIVNGDFELGTLSAGTAINGNAVNWTKAGKYTGDPAIANNGNDDPDDVGNYSLKIGWNTASAWGGAHVRVDTGYLNYAYGSDYIVRATVKSGNATHFTSASNRLEFYMVSPKGENRVTENSWIPSTTWQEFSKTFTTFERGETDDISAIPYFQRFQIRPYKSATADAELYIDNVKLEKVSRTSNASVASGNKSLMIKGYADGVQEKWTSDYANVNVGETVSVSAKVNVESIASYGTVSPKVSVVAEFDNGAKTEVASYNAATEGFVTANQNVTVPSGATSVRLVFTVDGEGVVYFDDASMSVEKVIEDKPVDVSGYVNKLKNPGFETTDGYNFPTGWDSNGKNLIVNGDFELGTLSAGTAINGNAVNWTRASNYTGNPSIENNGANEPASVGNYSLKIGWNTASAWGGAHVRVDTGYLNYAYGSDYIVRATVKSGNATHFTSSSNRLEFRMKSPKAENIVTEDSWIPSTTWQEFSKTFTTFERGETDDISAIPYFERFQVRPYKSATADAELYIDNVRLEKVSRSDTAEKNSGSKSLKIVAYDDGVDEIWTSDKVSVRENSEIAVGASFKSEGVTSGAVISVNYFNGNESKGRFVVTQNAKSDAWKNEAKITTVPEGATSAQIQITLPDGNGTVWVDDVILGSLPQDPYIENINYSVDDLYGNGGSDVEVTLNVTNLNNEQSVYAIAVLYDGFGDMIDVDASNVTIPANKENHPVVRTVTLPNVDLSDYYIKVMLWAGDGTLRPLCESYEFPQRTSTFTVNKVFQDGMILQRDKEISVYGQGTPGEPITVTMDNAKSTVTVDSEGEWVAILPAKPASTVGTTLTVSGRGERTFTFDDILMGDVFLVSGQSNAAFSISEVNEFTANPDAANDNIRVLGIYDIGNDRQPGSTVELKDLPTEAQLNTADKTGITDPTWLKFEPKSSEYDILRDPLTRDTSAIGYYVAKNIQNKLKEQTGDIVPVGVITAAVGGSRIERWIPAEVYDNDATLTADNAAQKSTLYNLMINPLTKFNVKGVLWYQGCANAANSQRYKKEMTYVIESWRERFDNENLPFVIHQLAGYGDQYALVRDSQRAVAKAMDNVDLTVLIDAGNKTDVHPQAKITAANRTAGIVLDKWYGISNNDGKFADFSKAENTVYNGKNGLKIYFENVVDGFYTVNKNGEKDSSAAPGGFLIADESGEFKVANVVINDDDTITIWNEAVTNPAYVRYAFEGFPYPEFANIYTGNNLPITPFRNDNINVEWQYERATIGSNVNMVLNGDFEKATENGTTFTDYFQHRATNASYGQFVIGAWDNADEQYGNTYAKATLKNASGNASTEVYTALTGAKGNMRLPMKPGKYIIEADVEATFTDDSTYLCMGWNYFNNNEVQTGARKHSTDASEWRVTKSTNGMEHIVGEITIGEEYEGCYFYAFGLNLYTKSSEEQSVKVDNLVIRRAE